MLATCKARDDVAELTHCLAKQHASEYAESVSVNAPSWCQMSASNALGKHAKAKKDMPQGRICCM